MIKTIPDTGAGRRSQYETEPSLRVHRKPSQEKLNFLPILPTRRVPTTQPVGQLLGVTIHFGPKLFQRQPFDPLVPSQPLYQVFWAGDRVVAEEFDDFRHAAQCDRRPAIFPVPNGGGCYANLCRDIFLVQSKRKTAAAQVVAESDGFFG